MSPVKKLKVIIAGGRDISADTVSIPTVVRGSGFHIGEIVSGACPTGVDALGEEFAKKFDIPVRRFPADWETHGKAAGPRRNAEMAHYADALILVWDGESKGSKSMLAEMRAMGKPIYQYMVTPCRRS